MSEKTKIEILQQYAINKGGILISSNYINNASKLIWQCKEAHIWKASWASIKDRNSWCPECFYIKNAIERQTDIQILQLHAINNGGKLISKEYISSLSPVIWECNKLHRWEARWADIQLGGWCPECYNLIRGSSQRENIEELQQYALNKEGQLLSNTYYNNKEHLIWKCKEGHQWFATWRNIKHRNQWCPECAAYKTEKLCKQLLEQKLGFEFRKTKFYYIDQKFEWDGYNEENKIAFEYQGYQHYEFPNMFHKTEDDFMKQKLRDNFKLWYAKEHNIKLLIIPYTENSNLESYIDSLLEEE